MIEKWTSRAPKKNSVIYVKNQKFLTSEMPVIIHVKLHDIWSLQASWWQ